MPPNRILLGMDRDGLDYITERNRAENGQDFTFLHLLFDLTVQIIHCSQVNVVQVHAQDKSLPVTYSESAHHRKINFVGFVASPCKIQ